MEGYNHEDAVAAFLKKRQVTRVPAACAARTQGSPSRGDQKILWDRFLAQEAELEKKRRRGPKQSKPYFPDPSLVESAKKHSTGRTDGECTVAISAIMTMMREHIALGATFRAIADNLNENGVFRSNGKQWEAGYVQKFFRSNSPAQP